MADPGGVTAGVVGVAAGVGYDYCSVLLPQGCP